MNKQKLKLIAQLERDAANFDEEVEAAAYNVKEYRRAIGECEAEAADSTTQANTKRAEAAAPRAELPTTPEEIPAPAAPPAAILVHLGRDTTSDYCGSCPGVYDSGAQDKCGRFAQELIFDHRGHRRLPECRAAALELNNLRAELLTLRVELKITPVPPGFY